MIEIAFSSAFRRAFEKKIKNNVFLEEKFWHKLNLFINNPFEKELKTHKLSGNLKDLWSFSVEADIRVVFYFIGNNEKAVFVNIGSHDEVY